MINSFPGYELVVEKGEDGKQHLRNMYRGVDVGFGGYVYAEHGYYENVALLDVASMHPSSIILLNLFGQYTSKYKEILDTRLMLKREQYDEARKMLGGKIEKYLDGENDKSLADGLKLALNSQYGLTSAKFDCAQHDPRNVNNIVALRGALFIKTLQDAVVEKGYSVVHCKTDSIKIPNADDEIISFCIDFAAQYGYDFEHEATFEKMLLATDADYVAKYKWAAKSKLIGQWTSTGAFFSHPYVFKTLFTKEPVIFQDLCETKSVTTALYLNLGNEDYKFIGRVGQFCPIQEDRGGAELVALRGEKYNAVSGTKGWKWLEASKVLELGKQDDVAMGYFEQMADKCYNKIAQFTDASIFCEDVQEVIDCPLGVQDIPCEGCAELCACAGKGGV